MEKINAVLVVLNPDALEEALKNLNLDKVNLLAIVTDAAGAKTLTVNTKQIPLMSFALDKKPMKKLLNAYNDLVWLVGGCINGVGDLYNTKRFLMTNGVDENKIVNIEPSAQLNPTWLANLRYVEENGADFFATGDDCTRDGLNLRFIPHGKGVNLCDSTQDLRQSFLTAKHIFEHVAPGSIKFVLIGLTPHLIIYDNAADFANSPRNLQYTFALNQPSENAHDQILNSVLADAAKNFSAKADLNFDALKATQNHEISGKAIVDWGKPKKTLSPAAAKENFLILRDYIKLCLDNGAKPVGVIFPFSPATRQNYSEKILTPFREMIHQLEENSAFTCIDLFDLNLGYDCFYDTAHLNSYGQSLANAVLSLKLWQLGLIPAENFCDMNYDYFDKLARIAPKDDYNALMDAVFAKSAELIRRKDKITIGFLLYESSMWCGDELYNFFAQDERFEPTVFLCLRRDKAAEELIKKDFWHGVEQFKSHGLNVVAMDEKKSSNPPRQDVLIYLTPFVNRLHSAFRLSKVTAKSLVVNMYYALDSSFHIKKYYSRPVHLISWKLFFSSIIERNLYRTKCIIGAPRGIYSGYPKQDIFFRHADDFHFEWKMTRHDSKKIIWAPHHSIKGTVNVTYATFQWNYQFMYEFAKAHLEISWVVKPHPNLLYSAVSNKIFPSTAAFKEYLQKWNELPNAQVYTGAYYQALFVTSDGMIHDSGSFMAEYQYVDKPMIYLRRDEQRYNDLGKKILDVSYCVDGKDLDTTAATMQRVFIEGDDYKADARRELFDKYLNYPKANGMLASEFIYKSISDDLKE